MTNKFSHIEAGSVWSTSEAKERLSEVLAIAQTRPQIIRNRAKPIAVLVSYEEFQRMQALSSKRSFDEIFGEARAIAAELGEEIQVPERRSRSLPSFED